MKNILLPTDFSENSWNAISYAAHLFKNEECTIHLLNTYQLAIYGAEYGVPNPSELMMMEAIKDASAMGLERMGERIEKEFNNPKHTISKVSSFNTLTGAMAELHEEYGIDYIVMGTKGATGAKKVLFGSNTVHVLNKAKCPVLAIPDDFDFEEPLEILFPSDYHIAFEPRHIKPIYDIAFQYKSKIKSFHVYYDESLTEEQLDNRNAMERLFKRVKFEVHSEKNQKIPEAVGNFISKEEINLLVMINNKHTFFENLFFKNKINEIGFQLSIPFLVIPS